MFILACTCRMRITSQCGLVCFQVTCVLTRGEHKRAPTLPPADEEETSEEPTAVVLNQVC